MIKKTTQFKQLLHSRETNFLMEAHNGLSAKIVEETGFKGLWASGLTISTSLGVRDNNELSWSQVLDMVEFMSDATTIPILMDADSGYGNFNNVRRLVKKLEQREVAAICLEDNLFPNINSLLKHEKHALANIEEFSGKIKAAKDTQKDPDFCVVARVQAFIAGYGLSETIKRAEAYYQAGADAILIHSALSKPDQVLSFINEWKNNCPVIIVPTMYHNTPSQIFEDVGVSIIIWANHLLRANISAMQLTAAEIYKHKSLLTVEEKISSIDEIFRLQNMQELLNAETKYLL